MRKPVIKSAQAECDIDDQAFYIAEDNLEASDRYLVAVHRAIQSLGSPLQQGMLCKINEPKLKGLRKLAVPGFRNYLIFFIETKDYVTVIRVLHGARDLPNVLKEEN